MKYFYILLLLFSSSLIFAQAPDIVWVQKITAKSQGFKNLSGVKLIEAKNNNGIVIAGNSNISVPWLAKFSANGINEWNRGRPFNDTIPSLILNGDQNAMILNENNDAFILNAFQKVNKPFTVTSRLINLALIKSDTTGTENLTSTDPNDQLINPISLCTSYNDNLVSIGNFNNNNNLVCIAYESDRFGRILNTSPIDTLKENAMLLRPVSVNQFANEQYILTVSNSNYLSTNNNLYFILLDKNLNKIRNVAINFNVVEPNSVVNAKEIQVVGNEVFVFGNLVRNSAITKPFIAKFNSNLDLVKSIVLEEGNTLLAGYKVANSNIVIAGAVNKTNTKNNSDNFLAIVNSNLSSSKIYKWGDDNENVIRDVVANENEIYVTGSNDIDLYAAKFKQIANSVESNDTKYVISPNPASNYLSITGLNGDETLEIIDIKGVSILKSEANTNLDIENLPNGTYFLKINSKGYKEIQRFVVNH